MSLIKETKKHGNLFLRQFGYRVQKIRATDEFRFIPKHVRKLVQLTSVYGLVSDISGDIVECGVWRGRSLLFLTIFGYPTREIWGFDSFTGFPNAAHITPDDITPDSKALHMFSKTSSAYVKNLIVQSKVNATFVEKKVHIVPGFFNETLLHYKRPIAFLHIDADLYESHQNIFQCLYPRVVSGGIVVFDEYRQPQFPGATRAIDEFLHEQHLSIQHNWSGVWYIVKL